MKNYIVKNGRIILKDSILDGFDIVVENNIITDISQDVAVAGNFTIIDAKQAYVSPGFVEVHIHGCGTYGFDILGEGDLERAAGFLKQNGINTFVPTFQYNREVVNDVVRKIQQSSLLADIPGIYIEGPFISKEKKGGISADYIFDFTRERLEQIIGETEGLLKLMTIAPEKDGSREMVAYLNEHGVVPCYGHSNCEIKDVDIPGKYKTNITHLFNAMSGVSHKRSGLAMLPFINHDTFFELNGDGIHLNDETIRMCYSSLNREKLVMISDAVVSAGLEYGEYTSYNREIVSNEFGVRYKADNVLMGSNLLVNQILKRFVEQTGAPVYEAVRFVSYNPCQLLGIEHRRGSIEIGKDDDLILLDQELNVIENLRK